MPTSIIMNLPSLLICLLSFSLSLLPYATSYYFQKLRFDETSDNMVYEGDAVSGDGVVEFLNSASYSACRVGKATHAERIPLWNSHSRELTDFTTSFSFIMDTQGRPSFGSGFSFFLAPFGSHIPRNSAGGFLGLFNSTTCCDSSAKTKILLVEFDPYVNKWDPPYPHVGINKNSITSVETVHWNFSSLPDKSTIDAWIEYNATTTNLSVHWSYRYRSRTPVPIVSADKTSLSHRIDLRKILPEWIEAGFSAGTSQYGETKVLSWELSSSLDRIYPRPWLSENAKKKAMILGAVAVFFLLLGWFLRSRLKSKEGQRLPVRAPVPVPGDDSAATNDVVNSNYSGAEESDNLDGDGGLIIRSLSIQGIRRHITRF